MSAIVPVTGCSSNQPQITEPATGNTAAAQGLPGANWVMINSN